MSGGHQIGRDVPIGDIDPFRFLHEGLICWCLGSQRDSRFQGVAIMKLLRRRQFLHLAAVASALCILTIGTPGQSAWSQTARTFKIIVPYAPGGGGSVLARVLADQIERTQKVTIIVENRPGAGTVIGTEAVARAAPDGNTLLITNTTILINAHLRKQNYDPIRSFEPICRLAKSPGFITVNSVSRYRTLTDLLNAARANPGAITAAGFPANNSQISIEVLKRRANVDITFVPFPGSTPAVNALLGGHVTALSDNYATVAAHIKADNLRALATTSRERSEVLPDVPTVAEMGFKDYGVEGWWASSPRQRYRRQHWPSLPIGRLRPCRCPSSSRSLSHLASIRPSCVELSSPPIFKTSS